MVLHGMGLRCFTVALWAGESAVGHFFLCKLEWYVMRGANTGCIAGINQFEIPKPDCLTD
jgi:hypothetical protein